MFGVDPLSIGVGVLVWLAVRKQTSTEFGAMNPEREELFRNAMAHCADPSKLVKLAEIFHREGLKAQAIVLKKRAEWRARTEEKKKEHADIFARAMASKNIAAILNIAAAFEDMTATFKAEQLRKHAQALNEASLMAQAQAEEAAGENPPPQAEAKPEAKPEPKPEPKTETKPKNGAANNGVGSQANIPGNTELLPENIAS